MSRLFKRRGSEDDEPPEADVEEPPQDEAPTTSIVPVRDEAGRLAERLDADYEERSSPSVEMTPVNVPPSHEEWLIQQRAEIGAYYKSEGWMYSEGGEEEDKYMALWEDFYREIFSENVTPEEAWAAWERAIYMKGQFGAENNGMARYVEWLQIQCEVERSSRGSLHHVETKEGPVQWGVDETKLRERLGVLRKPEEELMSTSPDLVDVVQMMLDDIEHDFDVFAIIYTKANDNHGGVGSGKSDFEVVLLSMLDETFDLRYRIVFYRDTGRMDRLHRNTTPFIGWGWDEGEQWAFLQDWMKTDVKERAKEWMSRRGLHQKVIACFPQGRYVATPLQHRVTWSFRIVERGVIEVYRGSGWNEEGDHYGTDGEPLTVLQVGKLGHDMRAVYEACKTYAYTHEPGALDKKLALEAGKGHQWPYEELGIELPEAVEEQADAAAANGGEGQNAEPTDGGGEEEGD